MLDLSRWEPLLRRNVRVNFPFFLAPMVGLSHTALRQTIASYLPSQARTLLFTEMLSSRRLPTERIGDRPETIRDASEMGLVPQLVGNEERFIAASLSKLVALDPIAVDINMGCPVSKALKHNWGVALMSDPRFAEEVVRTTVRLSRWPVSVKIRTGLSDDPSYMVEFVQMLEGAGAAWVTIHPRFAAQQRRGRAQWSYIARARDAVGIPVIGNGDVQTGEDALRMLSETGCDGVMIGRAAVARPWIFWQIGAALGQSGPLSVEPRQPPEDAYAEGAEFDRAVRRFIHFAEHSFAPSDAMKRLRFYAHWGCRWLDFGHELWRRLANTTDFAECRLELDRFFAVPQRMCRRTALAS